jgi:hypothetical protein
MKTKITLFIILGINLTIFSQVVIKEFPENLQLYKRNNITNEANVTISGEINKSTGYTELTLEIYKNNFLHSTLNHMLKFNSDVAPFLFTPVIIAELSEYEFVLKTNNNVIIKQAERIVAGDLYLVQGQSNALNHQYGNNPFIHENIFVRSFKNNQWTYNPNTKIFGGIGYWFANYIVNEQNIPIAILNESKGSQPISYFLREDTNSYNQSTIYGQLLSRFTDAGFDKSDVSAIIWYQGEANGSDSLGYYTSMFDELYSDWKEDFNPKEVFVFQVHKGCGVINNSKLPEAQRQLQNNYSNLSVISTNGVLQGIDNCHYFNTNGYQILAKRLYDLVAYKFYNAAYNSNIYSPNISNISFLDSTRTKIRFDLLPADTVYEFENGVHSDFIIENSKVTVVDGGVINNQVTLNLSEPVIDVDEVKISYLGKNQAITPYIKNKNSIGMLNFNSLPVNEYLNSNFKEIIDGSWTYYYTNSNLVNPIFAIEILPIGLGSNSMVFNVDGIEVIDNNILISSLNSQKGKGNFILRKYWNLKTNKLTNGWVNIRFFYESNLETEVTNEVNNFVSKYNTDYTSDFLTIITNQTFKPLTQIDYNGYNITVKKAGETKEYGTYSGNAYLQLNKVNFESHHMGGGVIKKVESGVNTVIEAGTLRYNNQLHKFQGWNGDEWVNFNY